MKTFMFPGQGSQSRGMGGTLFDEFRELTEKANEVLGYSIKELCLDDPRRELGKTQFTQPALYVVNALSYLKRVGESAHKPDYLAGHSLGELNALWAAECFDFEVGLKLVQKRGELMSQAPSGAMAAILNATREEIEAILRDNGLHNIDLANYNTASQIVISGAIEEIGKAQQFFQGEKMLYYPLNTNGAFHSRFMRAARDKFQTFLQGFKLLHPKIPVIANVTAKPYQNGEVAENLSNQIANTVRWSESIQYLLEIGASRADPMQFEEIGHGDVLTKIVQTIQRQVPDLAKNTLARENGRSVEIHDRPATDVAVKPAVRSKPVAAVKVAAWNEQYPVGTKVRSLTEEYDDLETRTAAIVLFGHRAAVYMQGYNGYFDLDEIAPV